MNCRICLIDDDEIIGEALLERFDIENMDCDWYRDGSSALRALARRTYCVVVSDINLPDISGEELFSRAQKSGNAPPFLFITGYGSIDQAVRLLKKGAEDYLTKPFEVSELITKLQKLCPLSMHLDGGMPVLGVSESMQAIEITLTKLAASESTVLISGESGVGKEYAARFLHRASAARKNAPFVAINCGAISESLLEAELFGHEKGAFTGAIRGKRGLFEQAHGGTLFLDEIGDMPAAMQTKLLRAIQERSVTRIGSEKPIEVNIHLICATHRDLEQMVQNGTFREDLYYRINVVNVPIPPLRERRDDILWHAKSFLTKFGHRQNGQDFHLDPETERAMLSYPWPGNVRELRNCIERACVLSSSPAISPEIMFGKSWQETRPHLSELGGETLAQYIRQCERDYIAKALTENDNRINDTAEALGISRKTLWDKMRKLDLRA